MFSAIKNLLWDFDGVILNSMAIRDEGFVEVLKRFPEEQVDKLLLYHRKNGGLSRYVKFRYFFAEIRKESVTESYLAELSGSFSKIMLRKLINPELLINDSLRFIKKNCKNFNMHIVSGSDEEELKLICHGLGIASCFKSIHGSPRAKTTLIKELLAARGYNKSETALIGDSINDLEAARDNDVGFIGYNNEQLQGLETPYLSTFDKVVSI